MKVVLLLKHVAIAWNVLNLNAIPLPYKLVHKGIVNVVGIGFNILGSDRASGKRVALAVCMTILFDKAFRINTNG